MTDGEFYRELFDQAAAVCMTPVAAFGSYPLSSDGKKAPVLWKKLAEKDGEALLITEMCIDALPYEDFAGVTDWEHSSLRQKLNTDIFNEMFSDDEKQLIIEVTNENPDNSFFHAKGGEPSAGGRATKDKMFLLSPKEADEYFGKSSKAARLTDHARSKCRGSIPEDASGSYWLRGPGMRANLAVYVRPDGKIENTGYHTGSMDIAVRPAIRVNTESPDYERLVKERLLEIPEIPEKKPNNENTSAPHKRGALSLTFGVTGIILPVLFLILVVLGTYPRLQVMAAAAALGLFSGILGTAFGISSRKKSGLIISLIAVIFNLLFLGTLVYIMISGIWDLSKYL